MEMGYPPNLSGISFGCSLSIQFMISVQENLTSNVEYEMGEKHYEIAKEYKGGEVTLSRISPT